MDALQGKGPQSGFQRRRGRCLEKVSKDAEALTFGEKCHGSLRLWSLREQLGHRGPLGGTSPPSNVSPGSRGFGPVLVQCAQAVASSLTCVTHCKSSRRHMQQNCGRQHGQTGGVERGMGCSTGNSSRRQ